MYIRELLPKKKAEMNEIESRDNLYKIQIQFFEKN